MGQNQKQKDIAVLPYQSLYSAFVSTKNAFEPDPNPKMPNRYQKRAENTPNGAKLKTMR